MISVINIGKTPPTPAAEGQVRQVLGQEAGTRVVVAIHDVEAGRSYHCAASDRTQVVYVLEGGSASVSHTIGGSTTEHVAERRTGLYLEPGETATVTASNGPLRLLRVTVPKHSGKPTEVSSPSGYVFSETQLRKLVDERGFRERTFWVNKETGLSSSWDLQIGRMAYAPLAHSPRHVHHKSATGTIVPEHFYLIEDGTGEVAYDGGTLPVGPGDLVLIPSGEWHQLRSSDTGFDYIEFQAPFDFMTTMDHDPLGKNWYIKGTDDGTGKPKQWVQS